MRNFVPYFMSEKLVVIIMSTTENQNSYEDFPPFLKELFEKIVKNLDNEQVILVEKFLLKHVNVFASSDNDLGRTDKIKHTGGCCSNQATYEKSTYTLARRSGQTN